MSKDVHVGYSAYVVRHDDNTYSIKIGRGEASIKTELIVFDPKEMWRMLNDALSDNDKGKSGQTDNPSPASPAMAGQNILSGAPAGGQPAPTPDDGGARLRYKLLGKVPVDSQRISTSESERSSERGSLEDHYPR